MINRHFVNWVVFLTIGILCAFYYGGIGQVPFHPDESTYIFMSSDIDIFFKSPQSMFWNPENDGDIRQIYHKRDAPLTRYLIRLGRWLSSYNSLPVDWDWSKSWDENSIAGALPDPNLLLIGRLAVSFLFPLSLILMYQIGKTLHSRLCGWLILLLLGTNALVLIHTRRAMAESVLLFTTVLSVWSILKYHHKPIVLALSVMLAFNSKHSTIFLLPLGLFAIYYTCRLINAPWKKIIIKISIFLTVFLAGTIILNPFIWGYPIQAIISAVNSRQDLIQRQVATLSSINPDYQIDTIQKGIFYQVLQTFIAQPAIADVGNYLEQTKPAELLYYNNPFNHLFRSSIEGLIGLILTLFGIILSIRNIFDKKNMHRRSMTYLIICTLGQFLIILIFVPLPFQRYYLPVVPFCCIWIAFGICEILSPICKKTTGVFARNPKTPVEPG